MYHLDKKIKSFCLWKEKFQPQRQSEPSGTISRWPDWPRVFYLFPRSSPRAGVMGRRHHSAKWEPLSLSSSPPPLGGARSFRVIKPGIFRKGQSQHSSAKRQCELCNLWNRMFKEKLAMSEILHAHVCGTGQRAHGSLTECPKLASEFALNSHPREKQFKSQVWILLIGNWVDPLVILGIGFFISQMG